MCTPAWPSYRRTGPLTSCTSPSRANRSSVEDPAHVPGDLREPDPPLEEQTDRDLVRRVEGGRRGPAHLEGLPRQAEAGEPGRVRRFEAQGAERAQVEPGAGPRMPPRERQG